MHSNNLIDRLALDAVPVRAGSGAHDLAAAAALGGLGTLVLVLAGYGVQPGLALAPAADVFAMKLAFAGAIGAVALVLALALARPGADAVSWRWLALPALALGVPALVVLAQAPVAD